MHEWKVWGNENNHCDVGGVIVGRWVMLAKVHIVCNKRNFSREVWRVNNFLFSLYIISEGISTLPPYVYSHAEA